MNRTMTDSSIEVESLKGWSAEMRHTLPEELQPRTLDAADRDELFAARARGRHLQGLQADLERLVG